MPIISRFSKKDKKDIIDRKLDHTMEMLSDIRSQMSELNTRIETIESVLGNRLPPDILTERTFREEVKSGDDIINDIISKVEELTSNSTVRNILETRLDKKTSPVESRRIEAITNLLSQHGKLSSGELSNHIGLSRTRCNEYFKQMEDIGIVESTIIGKEKFYRLS